MRAAYQDGRVLLAGDAGACPLSRWRPGPETWACRMLPTSAGKLAATNPQPGSRPRFSIPIPQNEFRLLLDVIADSRAASVPCSRNPDTSRKSRSVTGLITTCSARHESLRQELALRLSGLAVRYDGQAGGCVTPGGGLADA